MKPETATVFAVAVWILPWDVVTRDPVENGQCALRSTYCAGTVLCYASSWDVYSFSLCRLSQENSVDFISLVQVHEVPWILSLSSPFPSANNWGKKTPTLLRALLFQGHGKYVMNTLPPW